MKLEMNISIEMICVTATIIALFLIGRYTYRNRSKSANHPLVIACSLFALVISITNAVFLIWSKHSSCDMCFNYSDLSITVLSILTTILLGWNIWTMLDIKGVDRKIQKLKDDISYVMGITYGNMSQIQATTISGMGKDLIVVSMLHNTITSLKILSKIPDTQKECDQIAETAADLLTNTNIQISALHASDLLEYLGSIENRDKINGIETIRQKLTKFIKNDIS